MQCLPPSASACLANPETDCMAFQGWSLPTSVKVRPNPAVCQGHIFHAFDFCFSTRNKHIKSVHRSRSPKRSRRSRSRSRSRERRSKSRSSSRPNLLQMSYDEYLAHFERVRRQRAAARPDSAPLQVWPRPAGQTEMCCWRDGIHAQLLSSSRCTVVIDVRT